MHPIEKPPLQTFTTFVEEESGVLECIIGVFDDDSRHILHPVAVRVASGTFEQLTSERLEEAINVHRWARRNLEVFKDGRVARDD